MGWLSNLMMIGGAVAAPFTGGASLALTAAGAQMSGAEKAAKTQKEAAEAAQKFETQVYEQTRADLAPYRTVGGEAMTTLGAVMGLGGGGPQAGGPGIGAETGLPKAVPKAPSKVSAFKRGMDYYKANHPSETPVMNARTLFTKPAAEETVQRQASQQTSSGYARMRSPEGDEADVPEELAGYYEQEGARRLS